MPTSASRPPCPTRCQRAHGYAFCSLLFPPLNHPPFPIHLRRSYAKKPRARRAKFRSHAGAFVNPIRYPIVLLVKGDGGAREIFHANKVLIPVFSVDTVRTGADEDTVITGATVKRIVAVVRSEER